MATGQLALSCSGDADEVDVDVDAEMLLELRCRNGARSGALGAALHWQCDSLSLRC